MEAWLIGMPVLSQAWLTEPRSPRSRKRERNYNTNLSLPWGWEKERKHNQPLYLHIKHTTLMPTRSVSTHTHSWTRTMALGTMGPASKIHSAGLLLPDIIPLTLLSFNLSPHTQPTRAIMEILKGPLVVSSKIRPWVICTRFCPANRPISCVILWYCNHTDWHYNNELFANMLVDKIWEWIACKCNKDAFKVIRSGPLGSLTLGGSDTLAFPFILGDGAWPVMWLNYCGALIMCFHWLGKQVLSFFSYLGVKGNRQGRDKSM